jgi:hypothetical protein
MRSFRLTLAASALGVAAVTSAAAQAVAPDLMGAYAPGGDCKQDPQVTIGQDLAVRVGGKTTRFAPLDSCQSCVGGARYEGIEVWVTYLGKNGDPMYPMFRVNADERRGVLIVDKNDLQSAPAPMRSVAMASPLKKCAAAR